MTMDNHSTMIPKALQKGDTIAFISPSMRLNSMFPDPLVRAQKLFEDQGFHVKIIFEPSEPTDFQKQILQRCEELHTAFRDPDIQAIICTLGGAHAHELLPHLDYELIRCNSKIFCGFSDITSLHCGIFSQTGLRTFYGPMAIDPLGGYHREPIKFTVDYFMKTITESGCVPLGQVPVSSEWTTEMDEDLMGSNEHKPLQMKNNPGWRWLRQGTATGPIFGGCLEPLMNLPGTKYWPDLSGCILLIETSLGEDPTKGVPLETVRAKFAALRILNVFGVISGLVVGRPYGYDDDQRRGFDQIIVEQTRGYDFPILIDVDIGHTTPMVTIPLGANVCLESKEHRFEILEGSVG